ncbi:unnamed protein product [Orchesella dallaii]
MPIMAAPAHLENRQSRRFWLCQLLLGSTYNTNPGIVFSVIMDSYFSLVVMVSAGFVLIVIAAYGSFVYFWTSTLINKTVNKTPQWENWFRILVRVGSFLNVIPIDYNRSTKLYYSTKSRFRRFIWNFLLVLAFADYICLHIAAKKIYLKDVGAQEYVDFYLHFFSRLTGYILTWSLAWRCKECVEGLNIMLANCKIWKARQNEFGEFFSGPIERSMKRTIKCTVIYVFLEPFIGLSVHLENRNSKRYWISQLLLRSSYDTTLGMVFSGIVDLYLSMLMMIPSATTVMFVSSYGSVVYFWSYTLATRYRSTPTNWKNGYLTYRSIQTIMKMMEPTFCKYLAHIVVYVCFWDLVLCACGLITCFGTFPLPVLIDFLICLLLMFYLLKQIINVGGSVLEQGEEFKAVARHRLNSSYRGKLMTKQLSSCARLKIYAGSHFYMQRSTFMVYMRLVFERTIDAILTVIDKQ